MNNILVQVKDFATNAHKGQRRKYRDEDYIMHLIRVMELIQQYNSSIPVLSAALLHDVLEDTSVSKKELHAFLTSAMDAPDADKTMQLVIDLTDVYTKTNYRKWNRRKRREQESLRLAETSAESQTIKYADIIDNCIGLTEADTDFAGVFLRECKALLGKMLNGNAALRQRAIDTVNNELALLQDAEHHSRQQ
jgi:(p)ppGpp synthase/HD superfamily hydrolase